jgi:hypothetical protein
MPESNPTLIDPLTDQLLTVDDIVERVAKIPGMRRPHRGTVLRWMFSGAQGVRLESIKLSGQRFSTEACLGRFFRLQNGTSDGADPTFFRLDRRRQAAKRKLAEAGI